MTVEYQGYLSQKIRVSCASTVCSVDALFIFVFIPALRVCDELIMSNYESDSRQKRGGNCPCYLPLPPCWRHCNCPFTHFCSQWSILSSFTIDRRSQPSHLSLCIARELIFHAFGHHHPLGFIIE